MTRGIQRSLGAVLHDLYQARAISWGMAPVTIAMHPPAASRPRPAGTQRRDHPQAWSTPDLIPDSAPRRSGSAVRSGNPAALPWHWVHRHAARGDVAADRDARPA